MISRLLHKFFTWRLSRLHASDPLAGSVMTYSDRCPCSRCRRQRRQDKERAEVDRLIQQIEKGES